MKLITIILSVILIFLLIGNIFLSKKIYNKKIQLNNYDNLIAQNNKLKLEQEKLINENNDLISKEQELNQQVEKIIKTQDDLTNNFENSKQTLENTYKQYEALIQKQTKEAIQQYYNEYLEILKEYVESFEKETLEKQQKIEELQYALADLQKTVKAATEANIRALQDKEKEDFYKLQISEEDLKEIKQLREVGKVLRNSEPLNKVIWKVYYEKPTTALLGRVVGAEKKTGIYKLTNLVNGMTYVGQALSIADRWRQHIKRGLGAETATKNKLYPAMKEYGVENFSFEIIEECSPEELYDKEQKWQDYFMSKTFGYSIK